VFHNHYKHIEIRCHFLRDRVQKKVMVLEYILSNLQVANILTESLAKGKFNMLRARLCLVESTFLAKRECEILNLVAQSLVLLLYGTTVPEEATSILVQSV
jgi:hypothetical protein